MLPRNLCFDRSNKCFLREILQSKKSWENIFMINSKLLNHLTKQVLGMRRHNIAKGSYKFTSLVNRGLFLLSLKTEF